MSRQVHLDFAYLLRSHLACSGLFDWLSQADRPGMSADDAGGIEVDEVLPVVPRPAGSKGRCTDGGWCCRAAAS
jgi:hypothetical protein